MLLDKTTGSTDNNVKDNQPNKCHYTIIFSLTCLIFDYVWLSLVLYISFACLVLFPTSFFFTFFLTYFKLFTYLFID